MATFSRSRFVSSFRSMANSQSSRSNLTAVVADFSVVFSGGGFLVQQRYLCMHARGEDSSCLSDYVVSSGGELHADTLRLPALRRKLNHQPI